MSFIVMNNNDLRREILSFLRKKARISCCRCNKIIIWDKKCRCKYIENKYTSSNKLEKYNCIDCYKKDMIFLVWAGT
tara:strand:+ start:275 stop:505 length:231 start_codon:yes stop_codon:yes gene_type:complete